MDKFKIVEDSTENETGNNCAEDIIKSSKELMDKKECLDFSIEGEKKMNLEINSEMARINVARVTSSTIQILQALEFDIMFDDGEGNIAILDDFCRIGVDYDMPNSVGMTFAKDLNPCHAAKFAMRFIKIADLLNISVFAWGNHKPGSIFNGKDVYSGRDVEDFE